MGKKEFLDRLHNELFGLPQEDIEERLSFYSEMIDDRMEEGLSEEEAVAQIGDVDQIISQIIAETPLTKLAKEKIATTKRLSGWDILLLILGFPLWFPLLISAVAVVFSLYVSLWSLIVSFWAVFGSLAGCALGLVTAGIIFAFVNLPIGIALVGAGLVCAGLSVLLFYGCKAATKGILILTRKCVIWVKNCFLHKEVA